MLGEVEALKREEKHIMETQTRHITFLLALVIAIALAGCGENKQQAPPQQQVEAPPEKQVADTDQNPPKQPVEDAVRAALPAFLSLDSIELERIPAGTEAVKVNFKAMVTPKGDLCVVDRESQVAGTPTVTLLKVVQTAAAKASLYGSVMAHRAMDQWTLEAVQIQVGLKQVGEPRGAFPPRSYVTGSDEANAALKEQAANAALVETEKQAARKKQEQEIKALAEDTVRASLPAMLSVESIELEKIPMDADPIMVKFQAIVAPKEDLCQLDRVSEVPRTPNVILIKIVQDAGTKVSIYGSVAVRRAADRWTAQPPEIQGLEQFGSAKSRAAFPSPSYITGSPEADEALKKQAAAWQAIKDELLKATAKGTRYIGTIVNTIVNNKEQRRILLVFVEQTDIMVVAEVSDPDRPDVKRKFGGKIVFDPKPDKNGESYSIELGPDGSGSKGKDDSGFMAWDPFYLSGDGSFKLRLPDKGVLEGKASMGMGGLQGDYTITLVPEKAP
jgi:hypothetical protein